jgi:hypothetical protein
MRIQWKAPEKSSEYIIQKETITARAKIAIIFSVKEMPLLAAIHDEYLMR